MAWVRAEESNRPDRLFDDPYARAFVAAAPGALPEWDASAGGDFMARVLHSAVVRTRFYDDFLMDACVRGCHQVVLLAAGLDSRAFRLPWPNGVHLWEVDLPDVLAFKDQVLTDAGAVPRCRRSVLAVDLREEWPARLAEVGFRPAQPTAWLLEGVLVYLTASEAAGVLADVGGLSVPGSRLACEDQDVDVRSRANESAMPRLSRFTGMWKGGLGRNTPAWLTERGWQVQLNDRDTVADGFGRPAPSPSAGGFITAVRTV
jgi:methyltransferase (TIGR00027 family)